MIAAAPAYGINHLQLSHHVVDDVSQLREPARQTLVGRLIGEAHRAGITEVVLWDHALYDLKYYDLIAKAGWPAETRGVRNPYGGMTFPLEAR